MKLPQHRKMFTPLRESRNISIYLFCVNYISQPDINRQLSWDVGYNCKTFVDNFPPFQKSESCQLLLENVSTGVKLKVRTLNFPLHNLFSLLFPRIILFLISHSSKIYSVFAPMSDIDFRLPKGRNLFERALASLYPYWQNQATKHEIKSNNGYHDKSSFPLFPTTLASSSIKSISTRLRFCPKYGFQFDFFLNCSKVWFPVANMFLHLIDLF